MTTPPLLDEGALHSLLERLDGWAYDADKRALRKRFSFKNYAQSLAFVNRISVIAEAQNHHPNISFGWGYAALEITTHDAGGVTQRDVVFVETIEV